MIFQHLNRLNLLRLQMGKKSNKTESLLPNINTQHNRQLILYTPKDVMSVMLFWVSQLAALVIIILWSWQGSLKLQLKKLN